MKKGVEDNAENIRQGGAEWKFEKRICYLGLTKHPAV